MLDETSYHTAIALYTGAAGLAMLCLAWWLGRRWGGAWTALVVLLCGAWLLTPAFPDAGTDTMAPALIVAAFQLFTAGFAAAEHALRPLVIATGAALVLAMLLRLTLFRRRPQGRDGQA